jgi:GTP-binding protein Era
MKTGNVLLVGRPNSGKSTLVNALVEKKISITSPKPQTTRRIIKGYWWDEQAQIIFWDTPGVFVKIKDQASKKINAITPSVLSQADLIVYLIDKTRQRGEEENRILGLVRKIRKPKIIAINKIDIRAPDYTYEYKFLEDEFDAWVEISALKRKNLKALLEEIIKRLPESDQPLFDPKTIGPFPAEGITPERFIADLIQEKIFLTLRQELPYTAAVKTEAIEDKGEMFYIRATIFTTADKYKRMIIGRKGETIKQIGSLARKEIELFVDQKVYLDLRVETDPHWPEVLLS